MRRRGQASLEAMAWLSVAALIAVVSSAAFAKGLSSAEGTRAGMELSRSMDSVFSAMDSVTEGGVRFVRVRIPAGLENASVSRGDFGETEVSFVFRGAGYSEVLPYRAIFAESSPLSMAGEQLVRVEKSGGVVMVSSVGGGNDNA